MGKLILVTGGARSGKSSFAEQYAADLKQPVTYIATGRMLDDEMRARVAHHQGSRPASWATIEADTHPDRALRGLSGAALLDCVTMLVTNIMMDENIDWDHHTREDDARVEALVSAQIDALIGAVQGEDVTLIAVTNELGMGLVPIYAFGRTFRDIAGRANQALARAADEVYFVVSGIPMKIR